MTTLLNKMAKANKATKASGTRSKTTRVLCVTRDAAGRILGAKVVKHVSL